MVRALALARRAKLQPQRARACAPRCSAAVAPPRVLTGARARGAADAPARPPARAQSASEIEETLKRVSAYPGAARSALRSPSLPIFRCVDAAATLRAHARLPAPLPPCFFAGVQGLIVVNADGIPIRTTLDNETSVQARAPAFRILRFLGGARRERRAAPHALLRGAAPPGGDEGALRRSCDTGCAAPAHADAWRQRTHSGFALF
jgi:hypothetical protein